MENFAGGFGCSPGEQTTFLAGALVGGGLFFGAGAIVTLGIATVYVAAQCNKDFLSTK